MAKVTLTIKEMNGKYACSGYFYAPGQKLLPGESVSLEKEEAEAHLDTGMVEVARKKKASKAE